MQEIKSLLNFLDSSPVNFWAVETLRKLLESKGYIHLDTADHWEIKTGGKYFITHNGSALLAVHTGDNPSAGFKIISAHSDSPGFRIKPHPAMRTAGNIIKLNTEVYGGPILYTWFDRPLSIAGRVISRGQNPLHPRTTLMRVDAPILTIPHLAIHFNRAVNEGNPLSRQKDMLPVLGHISENLEADNIISDLIKEHTGIDKKDLLDFDLSLYDTSKAGTVGLDGQYISSGRLDDLSMVHAAVCALTEATPSDKSMSCVMAIFDNEETGSGTKQGAASPILHHFMQRIVNGLGGNSEDYLRSVARSFMISADNAHGIHPNYPEKQDPTNHPVLGGGPVIKINANCKYMTDADSAAVYRTVCEEAGVPVQTFVNHSDTAGGSTLGNILTSQIPLRGVDMGAPLWAMHSVRETAAAIDHIYTIKSFKTFYNL
ncbi:MAG: M18 family aminopeptidase [Muribaculaceae bacterium]|nr:M18 family aminopeptidase [Muribaculaceae bacterium]